MKGNLKPANAKARVLLKKLEALAERGIDGEKISAQKKITRLKARFDFSASDPVEMPDLFQGNFKRSSNAKLIYSFGSNDFDVANSVKWAIESATKIPCLYRGGDLLAEATPSTANRLKGVAAHIANSFRTLIEQFRAVDGVSVTDRGAFVMGLYDGMMNEVREIGQRLPGRAASKKQVVAQVAHLNVHPYTIALGLGKQIRFSAPLEQISAELKAATQQQLT